MVIVIRTHTQLWRRQTDLSLVDCAKILEVYTLEEIFEINEIPEEEVLLFLLEQKFIRLPEVLPVDVQK
jgi:hypothetical protein